MLDTIEHMANSHWRIRLPNGVGSIYGYGSTSEVAVENAIASTLFRLQEERKVLRFLNRLLVKMKKETASMR